MYLKWQMIDKECLKYLIKNLIGNLKQNEYSMASSFAIYSSEVVKTVSGEVDKLSHEKLVTY